MDLIETNNITSCWGIKIKALKVLSERATFITTNDEKKFILKKKNSLKQVEREIELLKHLSNNKFLIQFPLINMYGEYSMQYQNDNYCIYNYLDGKPFSAFDCLRDPKVPHLLGEVIANLNKVMHKMEHINEYPNKDLYQMVYNYAVIEIEKVDNCEKLRKMYQELQEDIKIVVGALPKQLVHRDAHIHNILFENGSKIGVIDFEITEVNVSVFDICYCSTSVLSEVFSKEAARIEWLNFIGNLISGYNNINLLTLKELKSIWYVMLCIQTIFMAYFSNNKGMYEINKEMFKWIYKNKVNIENKLLIY